MAIIIPFPERPALSARFTVHDRVAVFRWEAAEQAGGRLGRLALHEDVACDEAEPVDFVLFYAPERQWAERGLRRGANGIITWCCADGAEQGPFATIEDALANVAASMAMARMQEAHSAQRKRGTRTMARTRNATLIRFPDTAGLSSPV